MARAESAVHAMLGLYPRTGQWLSDRYPSAVVTPPERSASGVVLEHLRFGPQNRLDAVPGLAGPFPSRLRDSVGLALRLGAQSVDLLLLRAPRGRPEQISQAEYAEYFASTLSRMPGVCVTAPDVLGRPAVLYGRTRRDSDLEWRRIRSLCAALGDTWRESWQLALFDAPLSDPPWASSELGLADACLFTWLGSPRALARHGWRSAAVVASAQRSRADDVVYLSHIGRTLELGPGRRIRRRTIPTPVEPSAQHGIINRVLLHDTGDTAQILSEETLRPPIGQWSIPVLRTVQGIHRLVRLAANDFVFRPVTELQSVALTVALNMALQPFVQAGVLRGLGGNPIPEVTAEPLRDRMAPGLSAMIGASVRPWAKRIELRVGVDPGNAATVELT
ncbi:MAG: hypothetical protein CL927_10330 [Deltaproteobacteria bacterium]|nr:hypothetical protein [Deltaproteobacteria bacterium]HCH65133.1 hypothetical protein [Deltaproteobacteria bacterium]